MRAFETCDGGLLGGVGGGLFCFFLCILMLRPCMLLLLRSLVECVMLRYENTVAQLKAMA